MIRAKLCVALVLSCFFGFTSGCNKKSPDPTTKAADAPAIDIDSSRPLSLSPLESCIADFQDHAGNTSANADVPISQVKDLVDKVVSAIGLQSPPSVVPCQDQNGAIEAQAISIPAERVASDGRRAAAGDYIVYDPTWVHRMVGADKPQLIALFGHEVGHIKNQDWGAMRLNIPVLQKEKDADFFAGCSLARMSVDIDDPEELFTRLRDSEASDHPSIFQGLEQLRNGFIKCGGIIAHTCRTPSNGIEKYADDRELEGKSGWRGGGYNQPAYCNDYVSELRGAHPSALIDVLRSSEETDSTCKPGNCTVYQYHCIVHLREGPIYKLAKSKDCTADNPK